MVRFDHKALQCSFVPTGTMVRFDHKALQCSFVLTETMLHFDHKALSVIPTGTILCFDHKVLQCSRNYAFIISFSAPSCRCQACEHPTVSPTATFPTAMPQNSERVTSLGFSYA